MFRHARSIGRRIKTLAHAMCGGESRRAGAPPIFELSPLERRMYLSLSPMIYAASSLPDGPAAPSLTVDFSATGTQAYQVTSVRVNYGDFVGGSPDIQTFALPSPLAYPVPLPTHPYAGGPGNYAVTATAYVNNTPFYAGGLSLDPGFGPKVYGQPTGISTERLSSGSANDAGYGIAIDASGTPSGNPNYGKIYMADTDGGQFAVTRYNPNGTPDPTFNPSGTPSDTLSLGLPGKAYAVAVDASGKRHRSAAVAVHLNAAQHQHPRRRDVLLHDHRPGPKQSIGPSRQLEVHAFTGQFASVLC
ncbi:MAG TPA: hypothetical protein VFC78_18985 [Tepidisphaeraceae bacterium]|nr:hypothetical protein [Tepidisphaeraceae bacterium]